MNHQHGYPDNADEWLDSLLGLPYEPEQVGTVGEWFILENGDYYKVATSEDIANHLKAGTPF